MATSNRDQLRLTHNRVVLEPLILIHGEDPFLVAAAAHEVRSDLCRDLISDLGLEEFKGSEDLDAVEQSLETPPFLAVRRVVMIWDPPQLQPTKRTARDRDGDRKDRRAKDAARLLRVLGERAETTATCVVVRAPLPTASAAVKGIRALGGEIRLVPRPRGRDLKAHVERRVRERGLKVPFSAVQLLTDVATRDMGWLEMELDKLVMYSADGLPIDPEAASLLITSAPPTELYRLTDALFKQPGRVGGMLDSLMNRPEMPPSVVVGALARLLRDLISLGDPGEREGWSQVPSWRLERLSTQLARAGGARLQRWLIALADLDWSIRTGGVDDREGLEMLLARIATELQQPVGSPRP